MTAQPYDWADNVRLFQPHGQPTLTRDEQQLLHQTRRLLRNLDLTRDELTAAVTADDPVRCATAVRSLMSIGVFLNLFAGEPV